MNKITLSLLLAVFGLSFQVNAMKFSGSGHRLGGGPRLGKITYQSKKFLRKFIAISSSVSSGIYNSKLVTAMKHEAVKGLKLGGKYTIKFLAYAAMFVLLYKTGILFYAGSACSGLVRAILADAVSGLAHGVTPQAPSIAARLFNGLGSYIF